jgi:spore germination protein KC
VLEIAELHNGESLSIEGAVKMLEQAADEYILAEVQNTLRIVQHEFRTDIYGFGQAVYRKRPELWRQIEHEWNEQAFPNLEVDVRVSSLLKTAAALLPRIGR